MIELVIFILFSANTVFVLFFAVAGHFYKRKPVREETKFSTIAVLVPCYKEDVVIHYTVEQLLLLDYPREAFKVFVIADSLKPTTIAKLREQPIEVIEVQFERSMKSRSLNYALAHIKEPFDIALVVDADNVLCEDFLKQINSLFINGTKVIQGQRVAKNADTSMAVLDGLSESINNHLLRKSHSTVGLSSALIGSGMAFPFEYLKEVMADIDTPVEDKALQLAIVGRGDKIWYQEGAIIYDEKVTSTEAYKNQRRRWIAGQYQMLYANFGKAFRLLAKGNFDFFNMALGHNLLPSRINSLILLGGISLITLVFYFNTPEVWMRWVGMLFLYIVCLLISTPRRLYTKQLLYSMMRLPNVILRTIQAVFQSRGATKVFIHTSHSKVHIDSSFKRK